MKKILMLIAASLCVACASVPVPSAQFAQAEAAISMASLAGAAQDAPVELKLANDLLAQARVSSAEGDQAGAGRDAERAAVHADLARVKTEQAKVRAELQAAQARNTELLNKIRSQESQ